MNCTRWHESLIERLYGEIGDEENAALAAHLEDCAACRERLGEFQRVRTLLREDEGEPLRIPRVVVLRDRFRFRPALLAASLLGAAVLAGAGAGAGYVLAGGRAPAPGAAATAAAPLVSTEELVRREVDRRLAALQGPKTEAAAKPVATAADTSGDRAVNAAELRAELAKFERRLNGTRANDLDYVLDQIAASEFRVGTRLGKTNQALKTVALANTSYLNEQ